MSHCRPADVLAHRIKGTPLPCCCEACRALADRWERERARRAGIAETLPEAFWAAQETHMLENIRLSAAPARPWALAVAGAAAVLALGIGLAVVLMRGAAPAVDDYEARYAAVQEALERSPIGELEACGVLLNETDESITTTEEEL